MKLLTKKSKFRFMPDYGRIEEISFYLFKFKLWTENHLAPQEDEPIKYDFETEQITGFNKWNKDYNNIPLSNDQFDKFQNQQINRL